MGTSLGSRFNLKLLIFCASIFALISFRLFLAALESGNWKGALISAVHAGITAAASYFIIRKPGDKAA